MNKRMQAVENKASELTKRKTMLLSDRRALIDILKECLPLPPSCSSLTDEASLDVTALQATWKAWDEERKRQVRLCVCVCSV